MTKRTVEQAVRDDLAAAEDEVARRVGLLEKAIERRTEALKAAAIAKESVEDAEARVIRARNALAAITGRSLDELIEETKARAATTGTHDPAALDPTKLANPANREGSSEPVASGGPVVGESGPEGFRIVRKPRS